MPLGRGRKQMITDAKVRALDECFLSHERDGTGESRLTMWDSPAEGRRRAVILYGNRVDLNGDAIIVVTTDCEVIEAYLG
jgi:hypothetical protein